MGYIWRFNTGIKGLTGYGSANVDLTWFTRFIRSTAGITEKLIWDNGQFNGYNGFTGFNPNTSRGAVILCNGVHKSLCLSQIGFGPYDNV